MTRRRSLVQIRRQRHRGDDGQKSWRRGALVEIYSDAQWPTIVGAARCVSAPLSVTSSSWTPAELALQRTATSSPGPRPNTHTRTGITRSDGSAGRRAGWLMRGSRLGCLEAVESGRVMLRGSLPLASVTKSVILSAGR